MSGLVRGLGQYKPVRCSLCDREATRGFVARRDGSVVCKDVQACEARRADHVGDQAMFLTGGAA